MIKKIAWDAFKKTGSIDTFLEMVKIEDLQQNLGKKLEAENYGNNENKWNSGERK